METKVRVRKNKLGTVLLRVESLFLAALCATLALFGYFIIRGMLYKRYEFYLKDMLDYLDSVIDKDDLAECMRTGVKSEKYLELQKVIDNFKEHHHIAWLYVIKPLNDSDNDNIMNVIAAMTNYEKEFEPQNEVGLNELTGSSYTPEVAKLYLDASKRIGEVSFFEDYTEEWGLAYTGMLPLVTSAGEDIAVLCVDIYINDISQTLLVYVMGVVGVMVVVGAVYITVNIMWLRKRIVMPLKKLGECVEEFADSSSGDDDGDNIEIFDPAIHTGDEIQVLSEQTVDMMHKLKDYISEVRTITVEKERVTAELNVAAKMQSDMLPKKFPDRSDIDIFATMNPAKIMGGDFYDFFMMDKDHMCLVMADVSGKGVPAAMFMIVAKTLLKIRTTAEGSPADMLRDVNNTLCMDNPSQMFVTTWLGVLTMSTGELVYANAGHEYLALMRADGDYELVEDDNMPPLATVEGLDYIDRTVMLKKGDKLFLYTDGVPEAKAPDGSRFGTDRMIEILNREKADSPKELLAKMQAEIDAFTAEGDQFDDVTMMNVIWNG